MVHQWPCGKNSNISEGAHELSSIVKDAAVYAYPPPPPQKPTTHTHTHPPPPTHTWQPWGYLEDKMSWRKENTISGISRLGIDERFDIWELYIHYFVFIATPLIYIVLLLLGGIKHTCMHFLCCTRKGAAAPLSFTSEQQFHWSNQNWDI